MGINMTNQVMCICGSPMVLRETGIFKYKDGTPRKFYGCSRYPDCKNTLGAHPDGRSLGHCADQATKKLRMECHSRIEYLLETGMKKGEIYSALATELGCSESEVHFGNMDAEQCQAALNLMASLCPEEDM